ncbi:MAG: flagellar biosynthetic protein FliQ [bacterium]|nr:flagellar biosynthetic protein FliQ [bacterium]MCP4966777.1 flagellar biosynthetic protein FliQ [bacterium]
MTDAQVIEIVSDAFQIAATVAGPMLMAALLVGVSVSLLQTITQIQEMTLTFVPKVVSMGLIVLFSGQWMIRTMTNWVVSLWSLIPSI